MTNQNHYNKSPLPLASLAQPNQLGNTMGNKLVFIGLDLTPSDTMDSGLVALDRHRVLLRSEKLAKDTDIIRTLDSISGPTNVVLVIDIPKSINILGKYRREEIQMHPLRIMREANPEEGFVKKPRSTRMRFYKGRALPAHYQADLSDDPIFAHQLAKRVRTLYDSLRQRYPTMVILLHYNAVAKARYQLHVPFKSNTTAGCKALQTAIAYQLEIGISPFGGGNLLPIALLEATIAAYSAWSLFSGIENEHYTLYTDGDRNYLEAIARVQGRTLAKPQPKYRRRYQRR
jgi:hypothetical protein